MTEPRKGVLAMVAACVIWGLSPLYYKLIAHIPPLEVLSHRTLWSLVFFGAVLVGQRRLGAVAVLLARPRAALMVGFAALMISTNWFLYIYSIQIGHTLQASLGYYMFPLVAVVLGGLVFGERLGALQWGAVALAAVAVTVLSLGAGAVPWISLVLATTFGMYGLAKKRSAAGPVVSVTAEVALLAPLAALWLWGVHTQGWQGIVERPGAIFGSNWRDSLILVFSGPITAGPLILFSYASRRISLSSVGLVQYLNPTLQFLVAVLVFAEPFSPAHAIAFALIWLALAIYSAQAIAQDRAARRASATSDTVAQA
jgi:chloramphenicol-sensitive protein RarD